MSPVTQQIVKNAGLYLGAVAGGSCVATLLINKCTSITTLRELPVNILAKIGVVYGLTMFIDKSIGTLLQAQYKEEKDKKTLVCSQAISNVLFTSIRLFAMYKLNIHGVKTISFVAALTAVTTGVQVYKGLKA